MNDSGNREDKEISKRENNPDISILEAGIDSLSKEIINLKNSFKDQRAENNNIIIGVIIALAFIVSSVAVEVIIFHTRDNSNTDEYSEQIKILKRDIKQIKSKLPENRNDGGAKSNQ